jgi:hypothetical protein
MTRKRKDGISPARPSSLASPSSLALYVRRAHPSSPALTKKHVGRLLGRLLERLIQISTKKSRKSRKSRRKSKRRDGNSRKSSPRKSSPRKSSPRKSSPREGLLLKFRRSPFRSPSRSPSLSPLHKMKEMQRATGGNAGVVDKLIGNTKEKRKK